MATDKKQVKVTGKLLGIDPMPYSSWSRYQFKVTIEADRKGYPVVFWQGCYNSEFDQESFLDCITNDCVAVMQYGRSIKSICQDYLILDCGLEEGSETIKTARLMRDNYDKMKHAFYNEEDFKDWVWSEFQRINNC